MTFLVERLADDGLPTGHRYALHELDAIDEFIRVAAAIEADA